MPEKNLLSASYEYLTDAAGEYVTVTDTTASGPLVTRKAPLATAGSPLTSHARHVLQSSTGNTVFARSLDTDIFARGAADALTDPRHALLTRRDSLIVDTSRIVLPGIYGQTRFGYSYYGTLNPASVTNTYGTGVYGTSTYAASTGATYGSSTYGSGQYA